MKLIKLKDDAGYIIESAMRGYKDTSNSYQWWITPRYAEHYCIFQEYENAKEMFDMLKTKKSKKSTLEGGEVIEGCSPIKQLLLKIANKL